MGMRIQEGWNFLQTALFNFKVRELNLYFDYKKFEWKCDHSAVLQKGEYLIYCGIFSKNASLQAFVEYLNKIKGKYFLFNHSDITGYYIKQCNGCGDKFTYKLIPDLQFHKCCDVHDYSYIICEDKTESNRKQIDTVFLFHMLQKCNHWWEKLLAYKFYMMVRLFGKRAFNEKVKKN